MFHHPHHSQPNCPRETGMDGKTLLLVCAFPLYVMMMMMMMMMFVVLMVLMVLRPGFTDLHAVSCELSVVF